MMRRVTVYALAALLLLSVISWIIYVPPAALQMLKPVPAHAQIIYHSATPDLAVLEQFHFSNGWKTADRFFKTLEKKPLTLAAVPLGGRHIDHRRSHFPQEGLQRARAGPLDRFTVQNQVHFPSLENP